jgi:hypothetical protein
MDASKDWDLRGDLAARRWGQSFVATGGGLAAVDVFINSGNDTDDMDITWKIMAVGHGTSQIGPTKTTKRAYFTPHNHLMGVSYNPGEVELTPGETYIIELTDEQDFTPYVHINPQNEYEDGRAYHDGVETDYDLCMTIMQYAYTEPPRNIDLDGSKRIQFWDFAILAQQWGQSGPDLSADFDYNNTVDALDLEAMLSFWPKWVGGTR